MNKYIVLDPGHGKNKLGLFRRPLMKLALNKMVHIVSGGKEHKDDYKNRHYREDIGTLKIAKATRAALERIDESSNINIECYLTREDERDAKQHLEEYYEKEYGSIPAWKKIWPGWKWIQWFTKHKNADVFVSIHTNAGGGTGPVGFYANHENGGKLADILCYKIAEHFDLKVRAVKKKRFLILRNTAKGNEVLFEVMFHDYPKDLSILIKQENINKIGQLIAEGIYDFINTGE